MADDLQGTLATIPGLRTYLGTGEYLRARDERQKLSDILSKGGDPEAMIRDLSMAGPSGVALAQHLGDLAKTQAAISDARRQSAVRSPGFVSRFMTPGAPAEEAIAQPPEEVGGGPGRPAIPEKSPGFDEQGYLNAAAAAGGIDPLALAKERIAERKPQFAPSRSPGYMVGGQFVATPENAAPGTLSVHTVQDRNSTTGWSYEDFRTGERKTGAPPPSSAAQQQAANAVTPETIKQMAERYRVDGTLPTFGWGASGAIVRAKILNEAASQAAADGSTGEQERIRQVGLGTIKQALGQLEKNRANITAFENTAARNADLVLQESEKTDRLGSPALDRWILAGKKNIAGDPQVARLDLAMRTFINEYARVTTTVTGGGITSDTARKEIESLLASKNTKEQVREVVALAKQEMRNRLSSYDDQVKVLRDRMQINPGSVPSTIEPPKAIQQSSVPSSQYIETRITPSGRKLGKKADGTIEEIK